MAVVCQGLTKQYGHGSNTFQALRGLDLTVATGELVMLVGPSGCGKTTLVSILSAVIEPDAGECRVLGQDLIAMTPDEKTRFRRTHVGFVFQTFNLLPALSLAENVAVPLFIAGRHRRTALAAAEQLLDRVGLAGRADAKPGELSGGQQQRVAIARALVHGPSLVVCDEPTSNLDHRNGQEMMKLLRDTALAANRTVIVVTHDPRILGYADRVVHMDDGRIVTAPAPSSSERVGG